MTGLLDVEVKVRVSLRHSAIYALHFVTREYQETILEKGIKKLLEQRNLARHFSKRKVEDHLYSVTFPFVEQDDNKTTKVIKPLFLGQADSTAIIEHGDHWKLKVNQLRKRNLLHGPVLFPVKGPEDVSFADIRFQAFEECAGFSGRRCH